MSESYPNDWAKVVLMVGPNGEVHAIGGDRDPGDPESDLPYVGLERIKESQVGLVVASQKKEWLELVVKKNIWHGGHSLVPVFVAECPECGEQLLIRTNEWETETGRPTGVEYECLGEEVDHAGHSWHQSDWQPVMDVVEKWFGVERG